MNPYFGEFRAHVDGNDFRAGGARLPDAYGPDARSLIDAFRDHWVSIRGQQVTVDRVIDVNGHYGREVLYSKVVGSMKFVGGIRIVAGSGYFVMVTANLKSGLTSDADLHHFFASLEVH